MSRRFKARTCPRTPNFLRAIFLRACGAKTFDLWPFLLAFSLVHFSIARLAAKI
jgi:hypothetical protein